MASEIPCLLLITVLTTWTACYGSTVCDDLVPGICQDLYRKHPNICNDPCYSEKICKRFCGNCTNIKCYSCDGVADPSQCNSTAICPTGNYSCIVAQTLTDDFNVVHKLGCASNSVCDENFHPAIGRRSIGGSVERRQIKRRCCSSDFCNKESKTSVTTNTPNTQTSPTRHPCADLDSHLCSTLAAAYPNMCSIDCVARDMCPQSCKSCVSCYECSEVPRPERCTNTTLCRTGQKCFTLETLTSTFQKGYRLGCMFESMCLAFANTAPNIFGKRQGFDLSLHGGCCDGEYCNHHNVMPKTTPTLTTPTFTTPTFTTPTFTTPTFTTTTFTTPTFTTLTSTTPTFTTPTFTTPTFTTPKYTSTPTTKKADVCCYNGNSYGIGEKWDDACRYKCECLNATGYYRCRNKCSTWNLPTTCHLNPPAPGKCCYTPKCPSDVVIQYPPGYTEE